MYSCFVGKGTEAGDIVVKGDIDLDSSCDQVLNSLELGEIIFAPYVVSISDEHTRNKSSQWSYPIPLADAQN